MRLAAASAVAFALLSSGCAAGADGMANGTFFRLILYNDTYGAWNGRSAEAFDGNGTCTAERGSCSVGNWSGPALYDGTEHLSLNGVSPKRWVFEGGCGKLYVGEPSYRDELRNQTWVSEGALALYVGGGCTTRVVNGTWSDYCPSEPGGGYHREYLLPVEETTTVRVGGRLCYNGTVMLGDGAFPLSVDSARMTLVDCTVNGSLSHVTVEHACRGRVVLDSAYQVMGWVKRCDRERFMSGCLDGCAAAHAPGSKSKGGAEGPDCMSICTNQADHKCQEDRSEKAECYRHPSGLYGSPLDGSSGYFIEKPADSPGDPCYCVHLWDPGNACMNNRVSEVSGEIFGCADSREYVIDMEPRLSCNGSYAESGGLIRGYVEVASDPDVATAYVFGGIPYRFQTFAPRHTLYRMVNGTGPAVREYRLQEGDYALNESHNVSGYFDFTYPETVPNRTPPKIGDDLVIEGFSGGNGSWRLDFMLFGRRLPENLTMTALTVGDRVGNLGAPCGWDSPCAGGGICVDGYCLDVSRLRNRTMNLTGCLVEAAPTNLTLAAPESVGEGADVSVYARLSSNGTALGGKNFTLSCGNFAKTSAVSGDDGTARFQLKAAADAFTCAGEYAGQFGLAPSSAAVTVGVRGEAFDWGMLAALAAVIALLVVAYALFEGGRNLSDGFDALRRLVS